MADLRIVDAPLLSTVKGTEKLPTGGEGNFSVSVNQVADFAKLKWFLATEGYVDNAVGNVQADLNLHKNNESNPHNVTKTQVGLGNVDNTADLDKPVSNATQSAIITANSGKADKSYVDSQDQLKADKVTVEASLLLKAEKVDLKASKIASDGGQTQQVINDFGGAKWHTKSGGYDLGSRVVLANGDVVKSTVANNVIDPNVDMIGWVGVSTKTAFVSNFGAKKGIDQPSDTAFNRAVLSLNAGDTLVVDGDYYLENDWTINKEINLDVRGDIYLNNASTDAAQNSIIFTQPIAFTKAGSIFTQLPKRGDSQLFFTVAFLVEIGNLAEYCFTLESTEVLTNRINFALPYYKNEINHFVSYEGFLAAPLDITYTDASALTVKFYKKQRPRYVNNLIPKVKGSVAGGRKFLVQQLHTNSQIFNTCGIDKESTSGGEGWAITRSCLNMYNKCVAIKTNNSGSDSYAFTGFIHGFNAFNNCSHVAKKTDSILKFLSGRHGKSYKVVGLQGALDEHWGYDLVIEDSEITSRSVISFAGGNLKLKNVNRSAQFSQDPLVMLRADTPTADGDLIIENCNIKGSALYAVRSGDEKTKSIRRKTFDKITIKDTTLDDYGYQSISLRGYESGTTYPNDTREQTELVLQNINYNRIADAANQYGLVNNNIIAGWNVFSKVTLINVVPKVIGVDTTTDSYYLFRYLQTDLLSAFGCHGFNAQGLVVGNGEFFGGSIGNAKGGFDTLDVTGMMTFTATKFNEDIRSVSMKASVIDRIGYVGCIFNTDKHLSYLSAISHMSGNVYGANISSTLYSQDLDITNYTNPNRRKQLGTSITVSTAIVIPIDGKSAVRTVSTVGARLGDFVRVAVAINANVSVESWVSANNAVSYVIVNRTGSELTIPVGTVINTRVSKM